MVIAIVSRLKIGNTTFHNTISVKLKPQLSN